MTKTKKKTATKKTVKKATVVPASEKTIISKAPEASKASLPAVISCASGKQSVFVRTVVILALFFANFCIWYMVGQQVQTLTIELEWNRPPQHPNKVVAEVDGEAILMADVREMAAAMPELENMPFEMVYPGLLDNMINTRILLKGAKDAKVDKDSKVRRMVKMAREQVIAQAYLTKKLEQSVTDAQMRHVYAEEVKNFIPQEEIHARHILLKTEKDARDVIVKLRAGEDFAVLADQRSLDQNSSGGDLGYFTKEMMVPEFGNAVFALRKGQLSAPIKTPFGWHVVQVEDKRMTVVPAFDDVKNQLKQALMEINVRQVLADERAKADVQIFRPVVN